MAKLRHYRKQRFLLAVFASALVPGCQSAKQLQVPRAVQSPTAVTGSFVAPNDAGEPDVLPASLDEPVDAVAELPSTQSEGREALTPGEPTLAESLAHLEALAISNNPTLRRMRQEAAVEWAQV